MKILITGSREATPEMLQAVKTYIDWADEHDAQVIVGDAPGMDAEVIRLCDERLIPLTVVGAYGKLRHRSKFPEQNCYIAGGYLDRDRLMAHKCDCCIAIWNGRSRGTKYTYDYAQSLGKQTVMWRVK